MFDYQKIKESAAPPRSWRSCFRRRRSAPRSARPGRSRPVRPSTPRRRSPRPMPETILVPADKLVRIPPRPGGPRRPEGSRARAASARPGRSSR